jgi:predicted ArsR family transcriptional regulator
MAPGDIEGILREVGRRLAARPSRTSEEEGLRERVERGLEVLGQFGGLAELQETEEGLVIRGYSCPLSATVAEHPAVCRLAEALLSEIIGTSVKEVCERNGTPRCRFVVAAGGA